MRNKIKLFVIAAFVLPVAAVAILNVGSATSASTPDDDVATAYKKQKCFVCHGPTALKKYDPCMAMEEQVHAIMEGKKGEKPPHMPGYESKGVTAEQAGALADYMIGLRTPPNGDTECPAEGGS